MKLIRAVRPLVAIGLGLALGACSHPGPGPGHPPVTRTPPTTTAPAAPLVRWASQGGMCPADQCSTVVTIARDGTWHAEQRGTTTEGHLDPATLRTLTRSVDTGVGSLADLKPGTCPLAYDGPSLTVTFSTGDRTVTVTNCDGRDPRNNKEIPGDNPLLLQTSRVVAGILRGRPAPAPALVEYSESGGHCIEMCPVLAARIGTGGDWEASTTTLSGTTTRTGTLDPATLARLENLVRTDIGSLGRLADSNGCPSAYDGQDIAFSFPTAVPPAKVSNCDKEIPGDSALLRVAGDVVHGVFD